jgi:hypothetical protein
MVFHRDKLADRREVALSKIYRQPASETTLCSAALEKHSDVVNKDLQHEPSVLTERPSPEYTPFQYQHNVSTATTLEEGPPLQQWKHPRINVGRSLVAFYGLIIMGANDAAYGVSSSTSFRPCSAHAPPRQ